MIVLMFLNEMVTLSQKRKKKKKKGNGEVN